jgi:tetratricopeptide (TPR) repeat protein
MQRIILVIEHDFELNFDRVFELRKSGALEEAYSILLELDRAKLNYGPVLGIMGHVCWELERLEEASQLFKRVTVLAPKSELASLGLFHTLFELGKTDDAFEEMKRFISISHSEEYERLLEDMKNSEAE